MVTCILRKFGRPCTHDKTRILTKSGDTFEWEETEVVRKAVEKTTSNYSKLEAKALMITE